MHPDDEGYGRPHGHLIHTDEDQADYDLDDALRDTPHAT